MKKLKYISEKYPIKEVHKMHISEQSRWFAFLNFIKFTNLYCRKASIKFDANKWNIQDVLDYIDTTSGDIEYMLLNHNGIPRKYSLDISDEESSNTQEIEYM